MSLKQMTQDDKKTLKALVLAIKQAYEKREQGIKLTLKDENIKDAYEKIANALLVTEGFGGLPLRLSPRTRLVLARKLQLLKWAREYNRKLKENGNSKPRLDTSGIEGIIKTIVDFALMTTLQRADDLYSRFFKVEGDEGTLWEMFKEWAKQKLIKED